MILPVMIVKPSHLRPIPKFLLPFTNATRSTQARSLHLQTHGELERRGTPKKPSRTQIPKPTPFVPDVPTFLSLIGRNLSQHASKIPSWKALFSLTSVQMEELGIGPPRNRRYLLAWRERFRQGRYGPGGTLEHVKDGEAELRIVELPVSGEGLAMTAPAPKRKIIINMPPGGSASDITALPSKSIPGVKIKAGNIITGPWVLPLPGRQRAKMVVKEGMWEIRRGRKIDGGERRRAEVQAKRRGEEKRAPR